MKLNKIFQKPFMAMKWEQDTMFACSKKYVDTYATAMKDWSESGNLTLVTLEQDIDEVSKALGKTEDFHELTFQERMACLPNKRSCFTARLPEVMPENYIHTFFTKYEDEEGDYLEVGVLVESKSHVTVCQYQGFVYDYINTPAEEDGFEFKIKCQVRYDPCEYDEVEGNNKPCVDIDDWKDSGNIEKWSSMVGTTFATFSYLLGHSKFKEFSTDVIPPIKVVKNAKRKGKLPPLRYKILNVNIFRRQGINTGLKFPDRMKPAEHFRRAHTRIVNGVRIPVRSSIINKGSDRKVIKDYNIVT
tara:strand:- start:18630 stop:19535 length:906 start_codon:yes stop_codon:yes gene_type:complete